MVDFAKMRAEANAKVAQEKLGLNIPSKVPASSALAPSSKYLTELELVEQVEDSDDSSITKWEEDFVKSLRKWITSFEAPSEKPLTPKQRQVLLKICVRCNIDMERAPAQLRSPPAPTLAEYTASRQQGISLDDIDDDIPF